MQTCWNCGKDIAVPKTAEVHGGHWVCAECRRSLEPTTANGTPAAPMLLDYARPAAPKMPINGYCCAFFLATLAGGLAWNELYVWIFCPNPHDDSRQILLMLVGMLAVLATFWFAGSLLVFRKRSRLSRAGYLVTVLGAFVYGIFPAACFLISDKDYEKFFSSRTSCS